MSEKTTAKEPTRRIALIEYLLARNLEAKASREIGRPATARIQASYDAARDSTEFARHWSHADALDADTANSKEKRHKLMHRSRYESGSNGYYDGTISTYCNMLISVGPKLRMLSDNRQWNKRVEAEFTLWATSRQLRAKLWCMAHTRVQDGEVFAMFVNNPVGDDIQLDLMLMEGEQVSTPYLPFNERGYIDGIRLDEFGNVMWYDVLEEHPGSSGYAGSLIALQQNAIQVPPSQMLHWKKMKRPQEHRSVPMCTSSLMTGANSRRWREASLRAAEIAADYAIMLETQYQPEQLDSLLPLETLDIEKGMMTALPEGWGARQLEAEFPTEFGADFNRQLVAEGARPMNMPYNAAAMDSSTYSFASGKLDYLAFREELDVERQECNESVLDPLFAEWYRERQMIGDLDGRRNETPEPHQWDWPAHKVIDEVATANATELRLKSGQTTLRQVYSDQGMDYEDALEQMSEDYGLPVEEMRKALRQTIFPHLAEAERARQAQRSAERVAQENGNVDRNEAGTPGPGGNQGQ